MLGFVHYLVCDHDHGSVEINCRFLGGFTVLSTKAVSTLLTTNGLNMFKLWMTYPILAVSFTATVMIVLVRIQQFDQVLIGTGVGQIRYLNRALMRFDSKASRP